MSARRSATPTALLLMLVSLCATACSSSPDVGVMMFANPGKYDYHTCEQINAARTGAIAREAVLRDLIAKAEQGTAGVIVGTMAYRGEHRTVIEEIAVIEVAARRKKCLTPKSWRSNNVIQ